MTIIEALVQLRNDLKLWVTNNLRTKVDKEDGKVLSSNDFTFEDKAKLDGIAESADAVSFAQNQTEGTAIGTLTINGTNYILYAPVTNSEGTIDLSKYMPLSGGTMSGNINMGSYSISNVSNISVDNMDVGTVSSSNSIIAPELNISNEDVSNGASISSGANELDGDGEIAAVLTFYGSSGDKPAILRNIGVPTNANDVANKKYVDEIVANATTNGTVDLSSYMPLSGGTLTGDVTFASKKGVELTDKTGTEYYGLYDNGTNLWIGAKQSASTHHTGQTYISSGYNGTNGGNETIKIAVPNGDNTGSTNYDVLHSGNYQSYISSSSSGMVREFKELVKAGTYTTETNLSKIYTVTVETGSVVGQIYPCVFDWQSIKEAGTIGFPVFDIAGRFAGNLTARYNSDGTITFSTNSNMNIHCICGYY